MDVVLVGLPGSGKTAVGRRLALRHRAEFVDLDAMIEGADGRAISEIFAAEGEAGFRDRERAAVATLGDPDPNRRVRRVVATGGGAVVDPRNRWRLYRGRVRVWLDGRPEVLAQRLRRSPIVRPLIAGREPISAVRSLAAARERFYAAAHRVGGGAELSSVVEAVEHLVADGPSDRTVLLRANTAIGRLTLGEGIAADGVMEALDKLEARRAILVSEPGAWSAVGERLAAELRTAGRTVETVMLPQGEAAKRLAIVEDAARALSGLRLERDEPLVAVGGGALGDTAGFLAAVWLRGVPIVHVPTTLVAQIDSSIGGKTAVDLPEGKNLVGAFHQPAAIVIDTSCLRSLPHRERRAALGEAAKMAALGDERLFELLEADGSAIASGTDEAFASGAIAELVERCAWGKVETVLADERETSGARIRLNLGHSIGHALEAADGYRTLLHGEAVAFGLRAACRIGVALGITPAARAERVERLLTVLGLGLGALPYPAELVLDGLAADKKHAGGRLRWVLPTAEGVEVRSDVPDDVVTSVLDGLLAGAQARAGAER